MPCFDGMHCVDFSKPESNEGSLPIAVGDYVAVHARTYVRVHHGVCLMWTRARGGVLAGGDVRDYVSGSVHRLFEYKQRLI
jgi:hypothetical protein